MPTRRFQHRAPLNWATAAAISLRRQSRMRRQAIIASVSKRPEHAFVPEESRAKFYQDTERLLRRAAAMVADLLVFSSMYRGGIQLQEWALDLGCHVISAIAAELGRIVDPGGQLLKLSTYEALIAHRVNLNKRQLHMDFNWGKMDEMLERYGPKLTFEYYTPEGRYVIGYEGDDRDVDDILREFNLEFRE